MPRAGVLEKHRLSPGGHGVVPVDDLHRPLGEIAGADLFDVEELAVGVPVILRDVMIQRIDCGPLSLESLQELSAAVTKDAGDRTLAIGLGRLVHDLHEVAVAQAFASVTRVDQTDCVHDSPIEAVRRGPSRWPPRRNRRLVRHRHGI